MANGNEVDVTAQGAGHVLHGFTLAQAHFLLAQHHAVQAQLRGGQLKTHAGAQAGLLKIQGHAFALQRGVGHALLAQHF